MDGVSGSVPQGGFLTLLFTGEVISLSSGIVVVHLTKKPELRRLTIVLGLGTSREPLVGFLKAMEKVNKHGGMFFLAELYTCLVFRVNRVLTIFLAAKSLCLHY